MFIIKMLRDKICLDTGNINHVVVSCKSYEVAFEKKLGSLCVALDNDDELETLGSILYERRSEFDGVFVPIDDVGKNDVVEVKEFILDGGAERYITAYEVFVCNENGKTIDKY